MLLEVSSKFYVQELEKNSEYSMKSVNLIL